MMQKTLTRPKETLEIKSIDEVTVPKRIEASFFDGDLQDAIEATSQRFASFYQEFTGKNAYDSVTSQILPEIVKSDEARAFQEGFLGQKLYADSEPASGNYAVFHDHGCDTRLAYEKALKAQI